MTNLDIAYNALGNITNKTDTSAYVYHPTKIHAVQTLGGEPAFQYDANGNGIGETSWSFALPTGVCSP